MQGRSALLIQAPEPILAHIKEELRMSFSREKGFETSRNIN